ncbi:MAG: hypothetical protein AVDCRST_MAG53-1687, partial [uncultured Solirubrobacteraceae bacterium]
DCAGAVALPQRALPPGADRGQAARDGALGIPPRPGDELGRPPAPRARQRSRARRRRRRGDRVRPGPRSRHGAGARRRVRTRRAGDRRRPAGDLLARTPRPGGRGALAERPPGGCRGQGPGLAGRRHPGRGDARPAAAHRHAVPLAHGHPCPEVRRAARSRSGAAGLLRRGHRAVRL